MRGHLDLREARLLDREWWLKARWTIEWLEAQLYAEAYRVKHGYHCSAMTVAGLSDEQYKWHTDQAGVNQTRVFKRLLPWLNLEVSTTQTQVQTLSTLWDQTFGSMKDPAVQSKVEATAAALLARHQGR